MPPRPVGGARPAVRPRPRGQVADSRMNTAVRRLPGLRHRACACVLGAPDVTALHEISSPASAHRRAGELGPGPRRPDVVGSVPRRRGEFDAARSRALRDASSAGGAGRHAGPHAVVPAARQRLAQGAGGSGARSARGAPHPEDPPRGAGAAGHRRPHAGPQRSATSRTRRRRERPGTPASPGTATASSADSRTSPPVTPSSSTRSRGNTSIASSARGWSNRRTSRYWTPRRRRR